MVEDGERVLSSVVASQLDTHGKYGGVVPELASREHLRAIVPVVRRAIGQTGLALSDMDAIAVTEGPGLVGSLLVGITYAKALCFAAKLPLIAVNHVEGHIHAVIMEARQSGAPVELPALALVASGGHTHLFEVEEGYRYRLLGKTRDDAAGEAFDKVAKLLGFGYPGGPVLDKLAPYGDARAVKFTIAKIKGNATDFSFSGLKTAVLRWFEQRDMEGEIAARRELLRSNSRPSVEEWLAVTPQATLDLIASFQRTRHRGATPSHSIFLRGHKRANRHHLRRRRLQCRSAGGVRARTPRGAHPVSHTRPLDRQRCHDRSGRISKARAAGDSQAGTWRPRPISRLARIWMSAQGRERPVDLLGEHRPCKLMRESHRRTKTATDQLARPIPGGRPS